MPFFSKEVYTILKRSNGKEVEVVSNDFVNLLLLVCENYYTKWACQGDMDTNGQLKVVFVHSSYQISLLKH
jgi:hypothetical protein